MSATASSRQSEEQPSPPTRLPSSQRSPSSTRPFPQDDAGSGSGGAGSGAPPSSSGDAGACATSGARSWHPQKTSVVRRKDRLFIFRIRNRSPRPVLYPSRSPPVALGGRRGQGRGWLTELRPGV